MPVRGETREIAPANYAETIMPDDAVFIRKTRGLLLGSAGTLRVEMAGGQILTFNALQAGIIHPMVIVRVFSTGTTATNIVGFW